MTEQEQGTVREEIWMYGGLRFYQGEKYHAWLPNLPAHEERDERIWKVKRGDGHFSVGGQYAVQAVRYEGSDRVAMRGTPQYRGVHDDEAVRQTMWARHHAARSAADLTALEKRGAKRDELDAALAPAIEMMKRVPYAQRDAVIAYVLRRLLKAW